MDQGLRDSNQRSGDCSRNLETVIAIGGNNLEGADGNSKESSPDKAAVEDVAARMERGEACSSCSIEVDYNHVVVGNQNVCRICHLSAKESGKSTVELMELGCGCKGELGVAHLQCAEAWFRVKGNRLCEICGEAARNMTGVGDNGFMEEWNARRWIDGDNNSTSDGRRRCLQGQPFCNLLMACLVIAFILPWFFRVNLF
ncbi:hypothetical protein C2S52_003500 [Perilla frutescens var. hirtella]|nr:hypothetical protein C2S51_012007 [Perilla frutescens var. frutescens]KAH6793023.1 hypothetical protein C2S52_003500 [Perilla frutescens var. hirtella]